VFPLCAGSGISPIKALIESGDLQADKRADVRLYYGTRDAGTVCGSCLLLALASVRVTLYVGFFPPAPGGWAGQPFLPSAWCHGASPFSQQQLTSCWHVCH